MPSTHLTVAALARLRTPATMPGMPSEDPTTTGAQWIESVLRRLPTLDASDLVLEPQDDGGLTALVRCTGVSRELDRCPSLATSGGIGRGRRLTHGVHAAGIHKGSGTGGCAA